MLHHHRATLVTGLFIHLIALWKSIFCYMTSSGDTVVCEQVDDGVWLTFERTGGRNKIKRIRFSQQRFPSEASWQAWWQARVATARMPKLEVYSTRS